MVDNVLKGFGLVQNHDMGAREVRVEHRNSLFKQHVMVQGLIVKSLIVAAATVVRPDCYERGTGHESQVCDHDVADPEPVEAHQIENYSIHYSGDSCLHPLSEHPSTKYQSFLKKEEECWAPI